MPKNKNKNEIIKALNDKVEIYSKASFAMKNGVMYVGNKGIEFYDNVNKKNYVQVPYEEIKAIRVQVLMFGKYIRGFYVDTKNTGSLNFLVTDSKEVLKVIRNYIDEKKLLRAKTLVSRITGVFRRKK